MRHTVEIADTAGNTMQLSVYVEEVDFGGSWYSLTKGMIKHHNGPVAQTTSGSWRMSDHNAELKAGGATGVFLAAFISWDTVNDQGTGWVRQDWVIGLTPGDIEWSIV